MTKLKLLARAATQITAVEYGLIAGLIVAAALIFGHRSASDANSPAMEFSQQSAR